MKTSVALTLPPVLALVLLFAPGCSRSADATGAAAKADDVARQFIEACNSRDRERFFALLTTPAREALEGDSGFDLAQASFDDFEIGETKVDGETAVVAVHVKGDAPEDLDVLMRREKKVWRVYGMRMEVAPGAEMTVEFEELGSMMEGIVEGLAESFEANMKASIAAEKARRRANFEGLRAVDDGEFSAQWKNTVDFTGRDGAGAVEELASALKLAVDFGGADAAFSGAVQQDLTARPRAECIEAIAVACGFHTVFPTVQEQLMAGADATVTPTVSFQKGTRSNPIRFVGPFVVSVGGLEERVPHGVGSLDLRIACYGVDPSILALLDSLTQTVEIDSVADARNRSLRPNETVSYLGGGMTLGPCYENTLRIELRNLLRDVTEIANVKGSQHLTVPKEVLSMEFELGSPGAVQSVEDVRVTLREVGANPTFDVEGPKETLEALLASAVATDAAGEDVTVHFVSLHSWGVQKSQLALNCDTPPAKVQLKLVRKRWNIEFPFELTSIPLPSHEQMPEKIEPLTFGDRDCPVVLGFRAIDRRNDQFPELGFEVVSHANKDAVTIHAQLFYLDSSGKQLEEFSATFTGAFDGMTMGPAVSAGATAVTKTTGFFMPDGAKSVRPRVDRVEFVDGTVWTRERP